jgi:hypothetical protein
MTSCLQLAMQDYRLPSIVAPKAPTVITTADVARNEACMTACTAAAEVLREIMDTVDRDVCEGALDYAFTSLDCMDWKARVTLFCPLGFWVLLRSGLLKAAADVCLSFTRQAKLSTYGRLQCWPNLRACLSLCWIS